MKFFSYLENLFFLVNYCELSLDLTLTKSGFQLRFGVDFLHSSGFFSVVVRCFSLFPAANVVLRP